MRAIRRLLGKLLLLLAALIAVGAWLSGVHIGNQVFTVEPVTSTGQAVVETAPAQGFGPKQLTGRVTLDNGRPLAGAMITASVGDDAYRLTVFSDADGWYQLDGDLPDKVELRVRATGAEDVFADMTLPAPPGKKLDVVMRPVIRPDLLAEEASASAHAALLDWPDADSGTAFVSQCHFCHQIGNELTRAPRTPEDWSDTVDRMEGYLVMLTDAQADTIKQVLAETFTGDQIPAMQTPDFSPALARARIEEWAAGDGMSFIHDADVGHDGRLYGVDEGHDVFWILDPAKGQVERVDFPDSDLPKGGNFAGLALPIGIFTGQHGPHSLAQGDDGRFWITNALSSTLMSYQPDNHRFEQFPIGRDTLYPHTIRIDGQGIIWFTLAASNQVARFDPSSQEFTIIDLPSNGFSRWLSDAFLPLILDIAGQFPRKNLHIPLSHYKITGEGREVLTMPYGIDVNPADGSVWYSKLYADRIGRIDPVTYEITEVETPLDGPRRPRFGKDGVLWIPSFDESALMRFDPKTGAFRTYPLPVLAEGEYETPYALNVHPETGDVWITSNLSDRVFRFDPKAESFTSYPSPTRVTFLRDLVFTQDGKVCSSQSNLPAYAIETGRPAFICIDPGEV